MPTAAQIPALEQELAASPADADVLVRLGAAYRAAGRTADARTVLERAVELGPVQPGAVLFLGLTYEDLDEPARARELYLRYLEVGRSAEVERLLRGRLPLLDQQELRLAVRAALAREAELAGATPAPATVAVFPFLYSGLDPQLQPLSRAMAELLVTDLAQTERLRVVERAHVQFLLDELQLADAGLVDPQTAARSGRLLAAGRVVQGQIEGDEALLRLRAAVVGLDRQSGGEPVSEADALRRLFELEKRLALGIFQSIGIELTPAERERVMRQPTASIEALLAYGHCLAAEDQGDFARAAAECERAATLDSGFTIARERATRAALVAAAQRAGTRRLHELGTDEFLGLAFDPLLPLQELLPGARDRGAAVEALGLEGFGQQGSLEIILRRPGGDE